jgi:hypothetical protein
MDLRLKNCIAGSITGKTSRSMDFSVGVLFCGLVVRVPGFRSRDSGFDSQRYHIFWEVMGLERGPLSLVSTIEELLERKSSNPGLKSRDYGSRNPSRWPRGTLYPQKLALTSPTSGGLLVDVVLSRTKATKFFLFKRVVCILIFSFLQYKTLFTGDRIIPATLRFSPCD